MIHAEVEGENENRTGVERVSRKELRSDEVVERLEAGQRVIVEVELFGSTKDVVLRKADGSYQCDTGLKLFSYDDPEAMKRCIERLRLAESD